MFCTLPVDFIKYSKWKKLGEKVIRLESCDQLLPSNEKSPD